MLDNPTRIQMEELIGNKPTKDVFETLFQIYTEMAAHPLQKERCSELKEAACKLSPGPKNVCPPTREQTITRLCQQGGLRKLFSDISDQCLKDAEEIRKTNAEKAEAIEDVVIALGSKAMDKALLTMERT